jgi:hypothetical protein
MSQKSSLIQPANSVSQALIPDTSSSRKEGADLLAAPDVHRVRHSRSLSLRRRTGAPRPNRSTKNVNTTKSRQFHDMLPSFFAGARWRR